MSDISTIVEDLTRTHPTSECDLQFGPVTEQKVDEVQDLLGVRLPSTFRSYLEHYAGGLMFGYEIFGIPTEASKMIPSSDASAIVDIVKANDRVREYFPQGHVFISSDGGDYQFFLGTSDMSGDECAVLLYGPGADGVEVADNFGHFLTRIANGDSFVSE